MDQQPQDQLERQGALSRIVHSVRTRCSFATAVVLLFVLVTFYVGGRIVLVHFLRDAEHQVQDIGLSVSRLVNQDSERVRTAATAAAARLAEGRSAAEVIAGRAHAASTFVVRLDGAGKFVEGVVCRDGADAPVCPLAAGDFSAYAAVFAKLVASPPGDSQAVGIMRIAGGVHYVAVAPVRGGGFALAGERFDLDAFTARVNTGLSGMSVKVVPRASGAPAPRVSLHARPQAAPEVRRKPSFGLAPMVNEALTFYSGGFWEFNASPLEASFTIRDAAGAPLSALTVSMPRTFSNVTTMALGRFTLFIAIGGMLLIIPIFWLQNQILLNPLSTMIERVRAIGEHHNDVDCPRLEWRGKDEFAHLAVSVNKMLETISRRAVAVAQSEASQKALIAGVPDGLAVFDRSGRLVSTIKQPDGAVAVPGLERPGEIEEGTWSKADLELFQTVLASVFALGDVGHVRMAVAGADGTRHFEVRLSRMDDHFALGVFRDITDETMEHDRRVAAEERVARASKQESMALLAAGIAHDVNNVLGVVLNTAEDAWQRGAAVPETRAAVETIRDAVHRGSRMMRELMTYAGEMKLELQPSDPCAIVREAQRLLKGVVSPKVVIAYDLPADLPPIEADHNQMWKVFFNLIKNAGEAMASRPGEIRVSAAACEITSAIIDTFPTMTSLKPGPGVVFRVADNGPGMSPQLQRRIFDPYVSTKSSGHGLGLAIVHSIVDAHGGAVRVSSSMVTGTAFEVYLPASKRPIEIAAAPVAAPTDVRNGAVLVVDDDASILRTVTILLKSMKREVYAAGTRRDALAEYRRRGADLACVLMDARLGAVDTVRLLRAFRMTEVDVPVIITSGSSAEQIADLFVGQAYDGFLPKPYTLAELKAAIDSVRAPTRAAPSPAVRDA